MKSILLPKNLKFLSLEASANKFIPSNQNLLNSTVKDHEDFFNKKVKPELPPSRVRNSVPVDPTDIKGLDHAAYKYLRTSLPKIPILDSNPFFQLKFLPVHHYISYARKSTVAYAFTNKGGYELNDEKLSKAWRQYKGPYKKTMFFQSKLIPLHSAVLRSRYRKLLKRSLHESVSKYISNESDLENVKGVFYFQLVRLPANSEDIISIKKHINASVKIVLTSANYNSKLSRVTALQNKKTENIKSLLKEVKRYNTLRPPRLPGYYPKLPFLAGLKPPL